MPQKNPRGVKNIASRAKLSSNVEAMRADLDSLARNVARRDVEEEHGPEIVHDVKVARRAAQLLRARVPSCPPASTSGRSLSRVDSGQYLPSMDRQSSMGRPNTPRGEASSSSTPRRFRHHVPSPSPCRFRAQVQEQLDRPDEKKNARVRPQAGEYSPAGSAV